MGTSCSMSQIKNPNSCEVRGQLHVSMCQEGYPFPMTVQSIVDDARFRGALDNQLSNAVFRNIALYLARHLNPTLDPNG